MAADRVQYRLSPWALGFVYPCSGDRLSDVARYLLRLASEGGGQEYESGLPAGRAHLAIQHVRLLAVRRVCRVGRCRSR